MTYRYMSVYILGNRTRKVNYTGVTGNLPKRVWEHKEGVGSEFTTKYKVKDLLYYEVFDSPQAAIAREKQIKSWSRKRKNKLVATMNPELKDLYETIL